MADYLLLFFVGLLAGAINAAAGGGSFITFPALVYAGVPPIQANASSTVALFPGSLTSAWKFKDYIQPFPGVSMPSMILLTLLGGCAGALLLLHTPADNFNQVVPWLLLVGSLAFAFGRRAGNWTETHSHRISGCIVRPVFTGHLWGIFRGNCRDYDDGDMVIIRFVGH